MNPIPCERCERPNECRRDRRCNRPIGMDPAIKELEQANEAFAAAALRVQNALAGLAAVWVIHKSQQP